MNLNEADILISEDRLKQRVMEMGRQITQDYAASDNMLVIGILRGSFIFMADLVRQIENSSLRLDFMAASSYGASSVSTGNVRIDKDITQPMEGRDVLVVEDIIDTGLTLSHIIDLFKLRGARSVRICCLLSKPERRKVAVPVDYIGFEVPDEFVVGYGLDYDDRYRQYPAVCVLKPEVYS